MEPTSPMTANTLAQSLPDGGTVDRAAQSAHEAIDRVAAKAGPAVERVRSVAATAAERLQSRADAFVDLEDEWLENARVYVRENPLKAVGMGLLAGMLISRLSR